MMSTVFGQSPYFPIAIGFFGLATGYFVWGGQALFNFPKDSPETNHTIALWGAWMSGFMQFITGIYLMIGLTWFGVFDKAAPLYMAALAFTAYGVHWFAVAYRRYIGASSMPEGWMAIPFSLIGILGTLVFFAAGDVPVGIVFIGLTLVYLTEIPTNFGVWPNGRRLIGFWQILTGIWLLYMTYGVTMNLALGKHWWV
jgi:hypothetical protein